MMLLVVTIAVVDIAILCVSLQQIYTTDNILIRNRYRYRQTFAQSERSNHDHVLSVSILKPQSDHLKHQKQSQMIEKYRYFLKKFTKKFLHAHL